MTDLLDLVLDAHGGLERWQQLREISAHVRVDGTLWHAKGYGGVLVDEHVTLDPHRQRISYAPFTEPDRRSRFEPERVAVETLDGRVVAERTAPRAAFAGFQLSTRWDDLHLAYFIGYAMWNYLTAPFLLTWPGVVAEEIEPWEENGESWRRLKVTFPPDIATHNPEQVFYYSADGLLRRHDYVAEVVHGETATPTAHYTDEHRSFSGMMFPTRRRALRINPDNTSRHGTPGVSIDVLDIDLT
ncbi:hypothetical protein ACQPZQ_15855 [Pseudonocardia sp. CA-142604]|uniref:hypothetical protein n=1 Tax=Pseudonocardia sp. CA-142604 TaxID=3240024 RepID=UPI003D89D08C